MPHMPAGPSTWHVERTVVDIDSSDTRGNCNSPTDCVRFIPEPDTSLIDSHRPVDNTEAEQPAGSLTDYNLGSSDDLLEMAVAPESLKEDDTQPDSFETVVFGDGGAPTYRQQQDSGYFHCGRLIGVPSDHHNKALQGRTLIVLTVSNHGWSQCVCLCRHEGYNGKESRAFYRAHAAIYSGSRPRKFDKEENSAIQVNMSNNYKIKPNCYVNFEHTFTLSRDFSVASIGAVEDKWELIKEYQKVQDNMYKRKLEEIRADED